jgi:hypothetical protein
VFGCLQKEQEKFSGSVVVISKIFSNCLAKFCSKYRLMLSFCELKVVKVAYYNWISHVFSTLEVIYTQATNSQNSRVQRDKKRKEK